MADKPPSTIDTLKMIRAGLLLDEIGDELANLTKHVRESGKAGKLTLTLHVAPVKRGQGDIVTITDDVKVKLPALEKSSTVLYTDGDGNLSRRDPRQPVIPELVASATVHTFTPAGTGTEGAADSARKE